MITTKSLVLLEWNTGEGSPCLAVRQAETEAWRETRKVSQTLRVLLVIKISVLWENADNADCTVS